MFKNLILISIIFSSTLYAIQNPNLLGSSYDLSSKQSNFNNRPQEFNQVISKPINFKIENKGHNWATLSWQANDNSHSITGYHLYRDNILLAELSANQLIYKDTFLLESKNYNYEIYALGDTGWRSPANTLAVKTNKNSVPKITNSVAVININGINGIGNHVYTFIAVDANKDKLYFKLLGDDSARFLINQATGKLINKKYLVRQKEYRLTVEVSDGMSKSQSNMTIRT